MKSPVHLGSLWMLLVLCVQPVSNGKDEPEWKIVTRTLEHAPDGSPDSRTNFGIGEWVELKVEPQTISNVEWIIGGDCIVSNRFGNPSLLICGGGAGSLSLSAKVHDEPQAATSQPPKKQSKKKWLQLDTELQGLEKIADQPSAFSAQCSVIDDEGHLYEGLQEFQGEEVSRYIRLLNDLSRLSYRATGTSSWVAIQSSVLESSAMRVGLYLDSTADKNKLGKDFWDLLRTCTTTLNCQYKQFEEARRNANKRVENDKPPAVTLGLGGNGLVAPTGPAAVAGAFARGLPKLRFLLYVQVLNALPGTTRGQQKEALGRHGFSKDEADLLLNPLECSFKQ
ncbi:MAG: hypothetical protein J0L73_00020 [Verrucomicrobia bacterium]|nr:hypothetical protein [Verrucomicrobiota bacterium]